MIPSLVLPMTPTSLAEPVRHDFPEVRSKPINNKGCMMHVSQCIRCIGGRLLRVKQLMRSITVAVMIQAPPPPRVLSLGFLGEELHELHERHCSRMQRRTRANTSCKRKFSAFSSATSASSASFTASSKRAFSAFNSSCSTGNSKHQVAKASGVRLQSPASDAAVPCWGGRQDGKQTKVRAFRST